MSWETLLRTGFALGTPITANPSRGPPPRSAKVPLHVLVDHRPEKDHLVGAGDAVSLVGVNHQVETLALLDQGVDEPRRVLGVHVVVVSTVNEKEPALTPQGKLADRESTAAAERFEKRKESS